MEFEQWMEWFMPGWEDNDKFHRDMWRDIWDAGAQATADRRLELLEEVNDIIGELLDENPNSEYLGELVDRLAKELDDSRKDGLSDKRAI